MNVDWGAKVIHVLQSDLTQVAGTLYELDTDWFRLRLKDLEDDPEGIAFLDTHRHNTEVTVAGTTFARVIEIINGYSVEFEDGQYSVRLVGSNNNIFDIQNGILAQNNVQVIPGNAAGLIVTAEGGGGPTAGEVADAVWDELLAAHAIGGSAGEALDNAGAGADPGQIADAVWDEPDTDHDADDTFGHLLNEASDLPTAAETADAVWDEPMAGHQAPGSTGEALDDADAVADPAAVADAVWNEPTADHVAAGSFGAFVQRKLLTVAKYLGLR